MSSRRPGAVRSARPPFRVFVTATDTGVGKTQVAAALLSLLADAGLAPAPFKPYESGCARLSRPADALELRTAARSTDSLDQICVHRFRAPLAPGVAAARMGVVPDFRPVLAAFRGFGRRSLVAEGAGGLLVPLDPRRDVVDLIEALRLPVVLVGRAGLGTLNHTGLSLRLLEARRIPVRAVVLSRSSPAGDPSVEDNARWLSRRHGVPVLGPVPFIEDPARRRRAFRAVLKPLVEASR
ncbi:MAG TPA: dethiobiotin synthase [Myxococcaceae bacterium]|nr:dethiobiotin synthase [Myxococcaceae bacterium]